MKKQSRAGLKKMVGIFLVLCMILPQGLAMFAANEPFIVNDAGYNPVTSDLTQLNWESKYRSGFDTAYTQAISTDLSNGTNDHIVIDGTTVKFFGYYSGHVFDYIYYDAPAPADTTQVDDMFTFSINPDSKHTDMFHSLYSFGFMINCTRNADGTTSGYFLALEKTGLSMRLLDHANLTTLAANPANNNTGGAITVNGMRKVWSSTAYPTLPGVRSDYVLKSTYTTFTVLRNNVEIMTFDITKAAAADVPTGYAGGNGFGLYAAYVGGTTHSCSALSYAFMTDIGLLTSSVASTTSFDINILDETDPNAAPQNPPAYLATFTAEGYIGQSYTITPPPKIGVFAYIGDEDEIKGVYTNVAPQPISLAYANPTINVQNTDEKGAVISTDKIDALDLNTPYEVEAKPIAGYQVSGSARQTITLSKKTPTTTVGFRYDKLVMSTGGVPFTGDTNNMTWMIAAGVAALAMMIGLFIREKKIRKKS